MRPYVDDLDDLDLDASAMPGSRSASIRSVARSLPYWGAIAVRITGSRLPSSTQPSTRSSHS